MRLRLTIQRNGLPAANILWAVPDTNSATAYTVTRLLEDVNVIVPLEAEHWGLEHYVVEVAGFECLHFMPVGQCLKEDDHVSIRPLMRAEMRARTLTGRHQISHGGQHLVDGVPFGRPYLRQPNRPAVRIPPRKRQRLEEITDEEPDAAEALVAATPAPESNASEKTVRFGQPEVEVDLDGDEDEDEEAEDEYGRSIVPGVTDDYRQQMLDLERKLNARMLENIGPQADDDQTVEQAESVRLLKIQKDEKFDSTISSAKPKPSSKSSTKGVRFADDLDVSDAPQPVRAPEPTAASKPTTTISSTIVERPAQTTFQPPTAPSKPAKVSRFKSTRSNDPTTPLPNPQVTLPPPTPTGPAGRTLANTIVERTPTSEPEPAAPDEFDPAVLNREIAAEYHKARNKFIQQQGGFQPTDEDRASPIVEERNGQTKKVSRFMAAKLRAEGM